uniref:SAC3/GANP/THP3 conserved domain-containing protein n=2 Tax=Clytia hemisphaerica TaxID=252671 RepID=A0A7M5X973_9CNID
MEYYQLLPIEENLKHQVDEFKSYQLLLNIHDQAFIQRLLIDFFEESSSVLRLKEPSCRFQTVFSLYLSWSSGNFYRFFKKCHGLSFLESCCLLEHFTTIRVHFLDVLSAGFQSKHFKFNLEKMQDWFCFDNEKDLYEFLKHFNLPFDENNKQVNFQQKKTFQLESRSDRFDLIRKCTYIKLIENSRELESKNYTQVILPT